jgi:hypothetical protein
MDVKYAENLCLYLTCTDFFSSCHYSLNIYIELVMTSNLDIILKVLEACMGHGKYHTTLNKGLDQPSM